ncbi:hypothetical protein P170DRAFT_509445 [Aspergillus steynii IBT 23096]|uniref:Uncharacterized protein n=1 Tax=Aspergillus steynii IBT 23096 TaxID=1392250 RepID=A0A2I2G765_9EURO|nr:uncharacterized protein P170DRAFT_509445 [Aspergillus steynii IBT 23096]PLB48705.1 hypothetical protein P170DRAFT_509445 [Aspergillus steynii IBT 23096]
MASTLPSYAAENSPPSYEQVVKKLDNLVGPNPTPGKVLDVAKSLSKEDLNTLVENHDSHLPLKTDKQKQDFSIGSAKTASSDEASNYIKPAASAASRAAKEIKATFQQLQLKIAQVDNIHHSSFSKPLQELQKEYQDVLGDSRLLAVEISQYGTSFDLVVIKFCGDDSISITERQERIHSYIKKASEFEVKAKGIDNRFEGLVQSFSQLVNSFSEWAKDREGELTEKIKKLDDELKALNKKLSALQTAQLSVAAVGAAVLPVTTILSTLFPPFSSIILIGGLIAAGVAIGTSVGLIIAANAVKDEIEDKTSEKKNLEKDIEKIRQARQELVLLGNNSLSSFRACVQVLSGYWKFAIRDAKEIETWLEKGAQTADQPQYMKANLNHAVNNYQVMAQYLKEYALGVELE